jgi:uncharacterized membrane protein
VRTLLAITYADETSASAAGEEAHRLAGALGLDPDGVAVLVRDLQGRVEIMIRQQGGEGTGAGWGMLWNVLVEELFVVPGAPITLDAAFGDLLRGLVRPGTSALLAVLPHEPDGRQPDTVEALSRYGGTVVTCSLEVSPRLQVSPQLQVSPRLQVSPQLQAELP